MDKSWSKECNKTNRVLQREDASKWNFEPITEFSLILEKSSYKEQLKFQSLNPIE
tara:strand:- start:222 stop:386 length:165 start_codon:yes stop_codon:yes gene_type:complete